MKRPDPLLRAGSRRIRHPSCRPQIGSIDTQASQPELDHVAGNDELHRQFEVIQANFDVSLNGHLGHQKAGAELLSITILGFNRFDRRTRPPIETRVPPATRRVTEVVPKLFRTSEPLPDRAVAPVEDYLRIIP